VYFYIFDSFTNQPKYAKQIELIKLRLTDLGIISEKAKASPLQPVELLAREAILKRKYKNIIAVGGDRTAHIIINEILKAKENIAFGIIPIGKSNIGDLCGIPEGINACNIISARKIVKIDLGKLDHMFFSTSLELYFQESNGKKIFEFLNFFANKNLPEVEIDFRDEEEFEKNFKIKAKTEKIVVANLLPLDTKKVIEKYTNTKINVSPCDNLLTIFVFTKGRDRRFSVSIFYSKSLRLKSNKPFLCLVDGQKSKRLSNFVSIKPKALNIIVGKNRQF